jgi:hypothetical protein
MKKTILLCLFLLVAGISFSQKQLVLVHRGDIVARFGEGQYIRLVLKKNHRYTEGHIIELYDFSMITSSDTIEFKDILKIDVHKQRGAGYTKIAGGALVVFGLGYLGLDRLNYSVNNIGTQEVDPSVVRTSAIATGAGLVLLMIKPPRYQHVGNGYFLHTIDYNSPFYHR